jgi:hypothetical protein
MRWLGLAVVLLLVLFVVLKGRRMGRLFSNEHLAEVARALPDLKRWALESREDRPAAFQTSALAVVYTITREDTAWVHHLSVSSPITPARAAGTFFLGLLRTLLRLDAYPAEAFVSQNHVFHLVVHLSDDQESAFAAAPLEPADASKLHEIAVDGRRAILPLLKERVVPTPAHS